MVTDLKEADVVIESDDSSTNLLSVFTDENSSSLDILKCSFFSFFASSKKILNLCRVVLTSQSLSYRSDYIDVPCLPNILYELHIFLQPYTNSSKYSEKQYAYPYHTKMTLDTFCFPVSSSQILFLLNRYRLCSDYKLDTAINSAFVIITDKLIIRI